ncbi:tat pathway signal sequence [Diaporthe amygdali]|uniref:tat pathway signal sequence n=1 Tax=Phomopsis amygdali TaxID=1214568 RepID=UPI0022FEA589|nr:tat pathway signal sequence [Diaporthe amygdali]KAJ0124954.1 tat pathway signal sequence [Diaporthe amygdali]
MLFTKEKRDIRHSWGYKYEWTPEHQTKEQMRPLTFSYDLLGADCLDRLDAISPPRSTRPDPKSTVDDNTAGTPAPGDGKDAKPRRDLYALLEQHQASDPKLNELWTQVHTVPSWVDWDQIKRGQDVFYRYGGPSIVSLTFQSLVGGMGGWRVVETLARTGGFGAKVAKRRLLETFQHILQVTKDLDSIQPGGEGFASSVKVRLLHASVRRRILALARERPGYFDVDAWGVPINDLDCIGTVLSFSSALIWIGLPRQGIYLREQEIVDYSALWRWVGYLLGTPADTWLVDYRRSKVLFESLIEADINPSDKSGVLANNILTGLSCQPPTFVSREFLCAEAYWLNGWELSRALGIERPSLWHQALVAGQCLYFMGTCYLYRSIPQWDERKNERVRKFFYHLTVHNKEIGLGRETDFDFKYVPQLGRTTELGQFESSRLRIGSSERQGLTTLVLASALVAAVAWSGFRAATNLLAVVHVVS